MKLSNMADNVNHQTIEIAFEIDGEDEVIKLEPLKKLEWGNIQNELGTNMWKQIIGATAEMQDGDQQAGMMNIMGELDDRVQLEMFYQKFKNRDPDITREQVDNLITYGIEDQEEYFKALMFLFRGVDISEAKEELEDTGGSKNQKEATEEE